MFKKIVSVYYRVRTFTDWYKLVFPFNRIYKNNTTVLLRGWGPVHIENIFGQDLNAFIDLITLDEYKIKNIRLPKYPTVVDIGANIGAFSILIKKNFPNAVIESYEPNPRNYALLKLNASFTLTHKNAVAGTAGTLRFDTKRSSMTTRVDASGDLAVEAVSFKDILQRVGHIDLVKIDIEGGEYNIFDSLQPTDLSSVDSIIMEIHGTETQNSALLEKLSIAGYSISWIQKGLLYAVRSTV